MCFDYSVLLGKITEKYRTRSNFALAMELSERSVSLKLNGKVPWKDTEISKAIELLGLDGSDIPTYFFKQKVHTA